MGSPGVPSATCTWLCAALGPQPGGDTSPQSEGRREGLKETGSAGLERVRLAASVLAVWGFKAVLEKLVNPC